MIRIEDFFPSYPQVGNIEFYEDIYKKKEFNDLKLEKYEKKYDKLLKHQKFISRFLSQHTPYNGLLLYHEMGSGKTCSSVAAAELIKKQSKIFSKAIYIARGQTLINKFIKEVACICTNGEYIPENEDCKSANFGLKRDPITREVKKFYKFYTYDELKKLLKKDYNNLVKIFSNSVIIIDEIQNIRHKIIFDNACEGDICKIQTKGIKKKEIEVDNEYKNFYKNLHKLFHNIRNFKILLLSGTPMRDLPKEIVDILNLILPLDRQIEIKKNFMDEYFTPLQNIEFKKTNTFITKYEFKQERKDEFKNKIRGYVSFLKKMENPDINITEEGVNFKNIKHFKVIPAELRTKVKQTLQNVGYIKALEKDLESNALSSNQMQASLFVWRYKDPNTENIEYKWGNELNNIVINFTQSFRKSKLLPEFTNQFKSLKKTSQKLSKLSQYSKIYAKIIANILKNRNELHYVYLNLVSGSGAQLFSQILNYFKIDNIPLVDNKAIDKFNNREYQIRNKPVAIGIPRIAEGINLENVQNIHIATPSRHFNNSETRQAIARAIRFGSHKELLKTSEKPIPVKIFKYMTITVNSKTLMPMYDLSINYDQYLRAEIKDYNIKQIDRLMMESAVDCQLNYNRNVKFQTDYSKECEYNKCEYKCEGITDLNPDIDYSTYNLYYVNTKKIIHDIRKLYKKKFIYTYNQLKNFLKNHSEFTLLNALANIIINKEILYNKWGIKSYLKNNNNLYYIYSNIKYNDLHMNFYCKNPSNKLILSTSKINRILLDNQLKLIIKNLNNICKTEAKICAQIFESFPLDIKLKLIENAIVSIDNDKNNSLKEWIINYNKNVIINLNDTLYITLDANNIKVLNGSVWEKSTKNLYPGEELFDKYIKNNEIKFYGIIENKEGEELFKIRDISKPEFYMYYKDKGNLIRSGKKCESYGVKDLKRFKKKLNLDLNASCNDIKNALMKIELILNNQQHIAIMNYCKDVYKRKRSGSNSEDNIINQLLKIKEQILTKNNISVLQLRELLQNPLKIGQQDTHEYCLDLILDKLSNYVKNLNKTNRKNFKKILGIDTSSIINWEEGEKVTVTESTSIILPIIPNTCKNLDEDDCEDPCKFSTNCKQTLQGLFEKYEEIEELKGDNKYETDAGDKVDATKQLKITHWPNFLIIILKRFTYDFELDTSIKVNDKIICVNEDLKFSYNSQNYELVSMNYHLGKYGSGHYIAYSKVSGIWYEIDDTGVEKVEKDIVQDKSENAYILIFKKTRSKNSPKTHYKPAGINNDGNTCYFNSCLQTLLAIEPLWKFFKNLKKKSKNKKPKK